MKIIKANYGEVDCTEKIQSKVNGDKLIVRSNNDIIGDPLPGILKYLDLEIEYNNSIHNFKIKEHELFVFPKSQNKKLGIFYSNNNNPSIFPAIQASLNSIKKASIDKADIITCMWQHDPKNPFPEFISWVKNAGHLNQLLQVMQLLYQAKEINSYEYVSFLEHDVLYPEGYFDFPDINEGEVMTNMNYMGLCKNGWQHLGQKDEPFHQMTMRFDEAIKHCENILANALIRNSGLIEPQNVQRKTWNCINPSVHINHGLHFTSHYNIYKKDDVYVDHQYWGNFESYRYLFDF